MWTGTRLLRGSVSAIAMMTVAGLAHAQDATPVAQTAQTAPATGAATSAPEQIVVTGFRLSLQKSMDVKREADGVVEAVSATDIGELPDKNIADALQRLPGINTIQSAAAGSGGFGENDRVEIRGTAPSLTQTLIDGHAVSSGDWFILDQLNAASRSVSYSLFPSEIVDHAVVYKSSQADLPEGGTAGSVNIVTRSPLTSFDKPITAEVTLGGAYSDLADRAGPQFNGLVAWKNDAGTLGVMIQGFREQRYLRRDGQEELGYAQVPSGATLPGPGGTTVANPFPAAIRGAYYPEIVNNALFEQERLRQGGDAAIEWKPNNKWDFKVDGFYSYLNAPNYNQGDLLSNDEFFNPNNHNYTAPSAYTVQNGIVTSATFPGSTLKGNPGINDIYRPDAGSSSYYVDLDGTYHPTENLSIHARAGYTRGKSQTDQYAYGTTSGSGSGASYGMNGTSPVSIAFPGAVGLNDPSNYGAFQGDASQDWVGGSFLAQVDNEVSGQVDVQYDFDAGLIQSIKAGVRITEHKRNETEAENYNCYAGACGTSLASISNGLFPSNFGSGAGFSTPFTLSVDANGLEAMLKNFFIIHAGQTPANRYCGAPNCASEAFKIKENTEAGYLMAKFGGEGNQSFSGNFGVRIASTTDAIDQFSDTPGFPGQNPDTGSAFGPFYINHLSNTYLDILPSFSIKYDVTKDIVTRFSAGQTMTRPDYYALAGGANLNDTLLSGVQGNPNLKPTRSTNLDWSTEWYYAPRASLTAGLFDMQMRSTFDAGTIQEHLFNLSQTSNPVNNPSGAPIFSTYTVTAPTNNSGSSRGMELAWQQPIAYGFGLVTNYTYAQSSQDNPTPGIGGRQMLGAAKHTGNITAYYENDIGVDAHLSYTAHSMIYQGIDRATKYFQDNGGQLDGAINYAINSHFTLGFDVLNITDETDKYVTNINGVEVPRAVYDNGRTFYLQLTAKY